MSVFFFVSLKNPPPISVFEQSNKVSYKWGYTLYNKWPNPTSKCIRIYNQFSCPTLYYQCFAESLGFKIPSNGPKWCRTVSESRGGSAVLLQVLGNGQYQDRGLASEIYIYTLNMQLPGTQMTSLSKVVFLPKQGHSNQNKAIPIKTRVIWVLGTYAGEQMTMDS